MESKACNNFVVDMLADNPKICKNCKMERIQHKTDSLPSKLPEKKKEPPKETQKKAAEVYKTPVQHEEKNEEPVAIPSIKERLNTYGKSLNENKEKGAINYVAPVTVQTSVKIKDSEVNTEKLKNIEKHTDPHKAAAELQKKKTTEPEKDIDPYSLKDRKLVYEKSLNENKEKGRISTDATLKSKAEVFEKKVSEKKDYPKEEPKKDVYQKTPSTVEVITDTPVLSIKDRISNYGKSLTENKEKGAITEVDPVKVDQKK